MNRGRSRKRPQSGSAGHMKRDGESAGGVEFDMKKARYDIIKFAMTGLSGTAKHDAETALAISLGAKAPKSAYVNYKDLQVTRKKEKEERETIRQNYSKPKTNKLDKDNKNKGSGSKKKPVKHSLETTGIFKVKRPPGSSPSSDNRRSKSKSNQKSRGKGRH